MPSKTSLWANTPVPEISKRVRREVTRAIDVHNLYLDPAGFDRLLESLWVLDDNPLAAWLDGGRAATIARHVHRNPGDWSTEGLLHGS